MKTTARRQVASDYMQRDIVAVSPSDTLQDALALMTSNHVTGLPVMDSNCRCIGLVTSSDILNYEQEQTGETSDRETTAFFDPERQEWETVPLSAFGLERLSEVQVSDVMSRDLVWVYRKTPLQEAAKTLINERVHRLLVMDDDRRLYGILSALDFARYVAEA